MHRWPTPELAGCGSDYLGSISVKTRLASDLDYHTSTYETVLVGYPLGLSIRPPFLTSVLRSRRSVCDLRPTPLRLRRLRQFDLLIRSVRDLVPRR